MSLKSRREYLATMRARYAMAKSKSQKSQILDEVVATLGYARKYTITVLRHPTKATPRRSAKPRKRKYEAALSVIQLVWEALDYPCAERLTPSCWPLPPSPTGNAVETWTGKSFSRDTPTSGS